MRRILPALLLVLGLILTGGCFSRPTEAQKKAEESGGNFDRMKNLKKGGIPAKDKGAATAPSGGAAPKGD